jgi:16S rRNA (cytidine1402-2'-O)-methyltransferase
MAAALGPRPAAVARELTKLFEEVRRGDLTELAGHYGEAGPPLGEVVVVIGPPGEAAPMADAAIDEALAEALRTRSLRDAVEDVAARTGEARRHVYARALVVARRQEGGDGD